MAASELLWAVLLTVFLPLLPFRVENEEEDTQDLMPPVSHCRDVALTQGREVSGGDRPLACSTGHCGEGSAHPLSPLSCRDMAQRDGHKPVPFLRQRQEKRGCG